MPSLAVYVDSDMGKSVLVEKFNGDYVLGQATGRADRS
jgi:hypothetical protein